jgi:tetratricopeptide (TPR) repeat protein
MNTQQFIEEGTQLVGKLQLAEAEKRFANALEMEPGSSTPLIWLGRIALIQGQIDKANQLLDQAIANSPQNGEALMMRGFCELEKGNADNALQFFLKAQKSNPELQVYGPVARCYSLLEKPVDAEKAARKALEMNPHDSQAHFELASILSDRNQPVEALSHLVNAINSNPLFVKGYLALGSAFTLSGKTDEAIEVYRKGLAFMPNAHVLRDQLCALLAMKGDITSAMAQANECVRRRNHYGDHLRLGLYALLAGKFEIAEEAFLKSIELNPQSWEGHYNLAELYTTANLTEEARIQYESALNKGADEWKPYNGMGLWILRNMQNAQEATAYFQKAKDLAPSRPEPLLNLALASAASRNWESAKGYCETLMQIVPRESKSFQEAERLIDAIESEQARFV